MERLLGVLWKCFFLGTKTSRLTEPKVAEWEAKFWQWINSDTKDILISTPWLPDFKPWLWKKQCNILVTLWEISGGYSKVLQWLHTTQICYHWVATEPAGVAKRYCHPADTILEPQRAIIYFLNMYHVNMVPKTEKHKKLYSETGHCLSHMLSIPSSSLPLLK